jgi:toxin ParE1/3/4
VFWSERAVSDRNRIYDFIDAESPQSAIRVDERIANSIAALARFPETGRPGRVAGTRELVIQRTPFIAAYRAEGDVVFILRILHGAQEWPRRLPPW